MDTIKMDSLKEGDTLQIGDALYIASNFIEDDMIKAWKLKPAPLASAPTVPTVPDQAPPPDQHR